MENKEFRGLWTALITPFKEGNGIDNEVDFDELGRLIDMQVSAGVDGILLLGTTAENPTLTKDEGLEIVKYAVKRIAGKTKVMVNVGTNSTKASLDNVARFEKVKGIDVYLVVNPYYNKPTQTGLFKHFTTIAKSTKKPIILYNIKGRTAVNLETNTLIDIVSECPNVVGVKEASGDMLQIKEVIESSGDHFIVLSGDDGLTGELIANGGDGVISVTSNCIPKEMKEFIDLSLNIDERAKEKNAYLQDFFTSLFSQSNPLPTKVFLASKGIINEEYRLPMCKMDQKEREDFIKIVREYGF